MQRDCRNNRKDKGTMATQQLSIGTDDYNKGFNTGHDAGYAEAIEQILEMQQHRKELKEKRDAERKAKRTYYIKQKLLGLVAVVISILIPVVMDGDITASLLIFPMGVWLMFTKERAIEV